MTLRIQQLRERGKSAAINAAFPIVVFALVLQDHVSRISAAGDPNKYEGLDYLPSNFWEAGYSRLHSRLGVSVWDDLAEKGILAVVGMLLSINSAANTIREFFGSWAANIGGGDEGFGQYATQIDTLYGGVGNAINNNIGGPALMILSSLFVGFRLLAKTKTLRVWFPQFARVMAGIMVFFVTVNASMTGGGGTTADSRTRFSASWLTLTTTEALGASLNAFNEGFTNAASNVISGEGGSSDPAEWDTGIASGTNAGDVPHCDNVRTRLRGMAQSSLPVGSVKNILVSNDALTQLTSGVPWAYAQFHTVAEGRRVDCWALNELAGIPPDVSVTVLQADSGGKSSVPGAFIKVADQHNEKSTVGPWKSDETIDRIVIGMMFCKNGGEVRNDFRLVANEYSDGVFGIGRGPSEANAEQWNKSCSDFFQKGENAAFSFEDNPREIENRTPYSPLAFKMLDGWHGDSPGGSLGSVLISTIINIGVSLFLSFLYMYSAITSVFAVVLIAFASIFILLGAWPGRSKVLKNYLRTLIGALGAFLFLGLGIQLVVLSTSLLISFLGVPDSRWAGGVVSAYILIAAFLLNKMFKKIGWASPVSLKGGMAIAGGAALGGAGAMALANSRSGSSATHMMRRAAHRMSRGERDRRAYYKTFNRKNRDTPPSPGVKDNMVLGQPQAAAKSPGEVQPSSKDTMVGGAAAAGAAGAAVGAAAEARQKEREKLRTLDIDYDGAYGRRGHGLDFGPGATADPDNVPELAHEPTVHRSQLDKATSAGMYDAFKNSKVGRGVTKWAPRGLAGAGLAAATVFAAPAVGVALVGAAAATAVGGRIAGRAGAWTAAKAKNVGDQLDNRYWNNRIKARNAEITEWNENAAAAAAHNEKNNLRPGQEGYREIGPAPKTISQERSEARAAAAQEKEQTRRREMAERGEARHRAARNAENASNEASEDDKHAEPDHKNVSRDDPPAVPERSDEPSASSSREPVTTSSDQQPSSREPAATSPDQQPSSREPVTTSPDQQPSSREPAATSSDQQPLPPPNSETKDGRTGREQPKDDGRKPSINRGGGPSRTFEPPDTSAKETASRPDELGGNDPERD